MDSLPTTQRTALTYQFDEKALQQTLWSQLSGITRNIQVQPDRQLAESKLPDIPITEEKQEATFPGGIPISKRRRIESPDFDRLFSGDAGQASTSTTPQSGFASLQQTHDANQNTRLGDGQSRNTSSWSPTLPRSAEPDPLPSQPPSLGQTRQLAVGATSTAFGERISSMRMDNLFGFQSPLSQHGGAGLPSNLASESNPPTSFLDSESEHAWIPILDQLTRSQNQLIPGFDETRIQQSLTASLAGSGPSSTPRRNVPSGSQLHSYAPEEKLPEPAEENGGASDTSADVGHPT